MRGWIRFTLGALVLAVGVAGVAGILLAGNGRDRTTGSRVAPEVPPDRVPKGSPVESDQLPPEVSAHYRQVVPPDGIRPIYEPRFVSAARAGLDDGELVMGVEIDGVARAYPVGPLNFREMVNDRIGTVPFLVTW